MESITKEKAEIIFQIHAEYVCKYFGFGDDEEPTVRIVSKKDCYGEFESYHTEYEYKYTCDHGLIVTTKRYKNFITIIPSKRFDNETLIHELAHYVQKKIEGKTCCWDMKAANIRGSQKHDDEVCNRHAEYMIKIKNIIERKI